MFVIGTLMVLQSCQSYKQNLMFQQEGDISYMNVDVLNALANYIIKPNDRLEVQVYTQKGERIIDPEFELAEGGQNIENLRPALTYLIREDGTAKLPMIGSLRLEGLKLHEAEKLLEEKYAEYYKDPYVYLNYLNKRVIVLGAPEGQVIPIENENTRVSEILALSQAINNDAKAFNIRLIRGEEMYLVDFSTLEGFTRSNYIVQSEDVIYIEPIRRPFNEFLRDNGPAISIVSSLLSLIIVIISLNQ